MTWQLMKVSDASRCCYPIPPACWHTVASSRRSASALRTWIKGSHNGLVNRGIAGEMSSSVISTSLPIFEGFTRTSTRARPNGRNRASRTKRSPATHSRTRVSSCRWSGHTPTVCRNLEPMVGQLASTSRTRFVPTTQSAYRLPSRRTFQTWSGVHGSPRRFVAIPSTYPIFEIPRRVASSADHSLRSRHCHSSNWRAHARRHFCRHPDRRRGPPGVS
jgi:hypothetical protein